MTGPLAPKDVFLALVTGVAEGRWEELAELYAEHTDVVHPFHPLRAPPLRTRDELREHFRAAAQGPQLRRRVTNIRVHETRDPEVIIAEFQYEGTVAESGEAFELPGIFVMRVRDGKIVTSRDYLDHMASARVRGQLDDLVAALKASERPQD
jgi:ketosteroid isomerase-like protein